ncbi:hypothetical protein PP7435_CHR4-0063 [Komagataella phaffii CBS 7435]|uniref:SIS domain-containing protein n=2 Tax=Komagataella phaffii TaxID=460519 RepID=C4R985_KOMPG|nr:Hypothetical protein PAS_chr4_0890 [Komagataella phaffii GS115]AOA64434.1 GQ67_05348T0 [Komagataella phaffii]CAH2450379.1 hypothetical protein BQ9382_C4-0070 [Komagataella phaffii CBS 7435]AOA69931.1 GQ68_05265T0 [Komagataella phaffii GS115]CAY72160.1 Hypothetical protein PAS_chr4_0890 [Komagataella phaffii GS115]CCA40241.1 hypothetical protein PP7435_CHR4-0063 [Komagataella phaffii CBS 7435]
MSKASYDDIDVGIVGTILSNQAQAIGNLNSQYRTSWCLNELKNCLAIMMKSLDKRGKLVISGVGKSHKIATKISATMNSLSLHSAVLHPTEALHGDLGLLREENNDTLILISVSGKTSELISLLSYVPNDIAVILLTCTRDSILARDHRVKGVLYAELPYQFSESYLYGLSAPTISTTLCLTLMDSVSIALAEAYIKDKQLRQRLFGERHPGGVIGEEYSRGSTASLNTQFSTSIGLYSSSSNTDSNTVETPDESIEPYGLEGKLVYHTSKIPQNQLKLLQVITANDVLVIAGSFAIECQKIRDIFKANSANTELEFTDLLNQIEGHLVPI